MKKIAIAAAFVAAAAATTAHAQTADQTVGFDVQAISQIAFTGSPDLVINAATAGSAPTSATGSATYAITTNELNQKVTAQLDQAMPSGVTLSVVLAAPTGGTSTGTVALGTSAQDVVTDIATVNESGLSVGYTLAATSAAGVVNGSRTVTYTITAGV
ncbi:MAG TPA: hypothetical protein VFH27_04895 [Longimicrobiaceae bacterium]|nr:hypothetical protein [Longimicrobiaceae bacterium]